MSKMDLTLHDFVALLLCTAFFALLYHLFKYYDEMKLVSRVHFHYSALCGTNLRNFASHQLAALKSPEE